MRIKYKLLLIHSWGERLLFTTNEWLNRHEGRFRARMRSCPLSSNHSVLIV